MDNLPGKITLRWFEKYGDKLINCEYIDFVSIEKLCDLLNLKHENYPFVGGAYPVRENEKEILQKLVKHRFNFSLYDYFIGYYV